MPQLHKDDHSRGPCCPTSHTLTPNTWKLTKSQVRFLSSIKRWEVMFHLLALTDGASNHYWDAWRPMRPFILPIVSWEHNMMFCLEIKGPPPGSSFMEPSSSSLHFEDSFRPSNGPISHYFIILTSFKWLIFHFMSYFLVLSPKTCNFVHWNIIMGCIRLNKIEVPHINKRGLILYFIITWILISLLEELELETLDKIWMFGCF